jgi:carboxypeptidase Q
MYAHGMLRRLSRFALAVLVVPALLFPVLHALPAPSSEPVDAEMVARIREEAFERSQVMQHAAVLTQEIGQRLTGSANMDRAVKWTSQWFAEQGLSRPRLEQWEPFRQSWEKLQPVSLRLLTPEPRPLEAITLPWSRPTNKAVPARVVHITATEAGELAPYRGQRSGGGPQQQQQERPRRHDEASLARLAQPVQPPQGGPSDPEAARRRVEFQRALRELLNREKPIAVVRASGRATTVAGSGGAGTGVSPGEPSPYATVIVSQPDFAHLLKTLEADPGVKLELDLRARFGRAPPQYNVLAEIPGSDKGDEVVMLGAHLDSVHVAQGATDNAAGSAVVMEAMRILKALGVQPRRTIRAALWTGEEQGLLGSRYYVRTNLAHRRTAPQTRGRAAATPAAEQPLLIGPGYHKLSAYFNMDNGSGRFRGIYLQGNDQLKEIFEAWMQPFRDLGVVLAAPRSTGSTDHVPFDAVGIPAFQFIQDPLDYNPLTHHTRRDVYEMLDPDDLKQAAAVLASFVYHAAMREEMLPRKAPPAELVPEPAAFRASSPAR